MLDCLGMSLMMMESGETVTTCCESRIEIDAGIDPGVVENEALNQEPIEDEIEETCCSWDYDLGNEGEEGWG
jgi:hypothetical protein